MQQFRYRAARPDGTLVEERVDGESELAVRTQLEGQGLLLFSLDGPRSAAALLSTRKIGNRLSLREFLVFNQEFLALVKSGLPILKTFDLLAERAVHPGFQAPRKGVQGAGLSRFPDSRGRGGGRVPVDICDADVRRNLRTKQQGAAGSDQD